MRLSLQAGQRTAPADIIIINRDRLVTGPMRLLLGEKMVREAAKIIPATQVSASKQETNYIFLKGSFLLKEPLGKFLPPTPNLPLWYAPLREYCRVKCHQ